MFERNFKIKIKKFIQITIWMLIFKRKTTNSLLFAGIKPSNISNALRTIVPGRRFPSNTLQFFKINLCEEDILLNLNKHLR